MTDLRVNTWILSLSQSPFRFPPLKPSRSFLNRNSQSSESFVRTSTPPNLAAPVLPALPFPKARPSSPLFTQVSLPFKVVDQTTPGRFPRKSNRKQRLRNSAPIHLTAPEDDGVKMRWFREEMRQSPVWTPFQTNADLQERDGSWTVREGEKKTPPMAAVSDDVEDSASSEGMEFVMVESTSLTTLDEPPIVIPLDLTKDEVIVEPVRTVQSQPTHGDVPATIQEDLRKRFTIRNGKVIPLPEPVKADPIVVAEPPPEVKPVKEVETPKTVSLLVEQPQRFPKSLHNGKRISPRFRSDRLRGIRMDGLRNRKRRFKSLRLSKPMETSLAEVSGASAMTAQYATFPSPLIRRSRQI